MVLTLCVLLAHLVDMRPNFQGITVGEFSGLIWCWNDDSTSQSLCGLKEVVTLLLLIKVVVVVGRQFSTLVM